MHRARLAGRGWGRWRGAWQSEAILVGDDAGAWRHLRRGRAVGRWPSLRVALAELWERRWVRGDAPWAVGWLGYEACADLAGEGARRCGVSGAPAGWWLLEPTPAPEPAVNGGGPRPGATVAASLDDDAFRAGVATVRRAIVDGTVYQVNLTRRFRVAPWRGGLASLWQAARRGGAPPYLALLEHGDGEVLCASMELLLRRRGTRVETRPIKGTRPRGEGAAADRALAVELAGDAKERAELAMVVDLERNDLGRVARPGSVRVRDAGSVHSFATVHHRVARVTAAVQPDLPWWDLLAAVAPGGSVTGCPKLAAMELVAVLEPVSRGPYCGALGVVAGNGDLELALPIRTAWRCGGVVQLAAGCGVVWGSDPGAEERESRLKVARWLPELPEGSWS